MTLRRRLGTTAGVLLLATAALAGCSGSGHRAATATHAPAPSASQDSGRPAGEPLPHKPLRPGERLVRLAMPEPYTPAAP